MLDRSASYRKKPATISVSRTPPRRPAGFLRGNGALKEWRLREDLVWPEN